MTLYYCIHLLMLSYSVIAIIDLMLCNGQHPCGNDARIIVFLIIAHPEAVKLKPSVIELMLKNKAQMVRKVARSNPTAPLQG